MPLNPASRAGHGVLYVAAQDLLKQLRAARADSSYDRRLLRFTTPARMSSMERLEVISVTMSAVTVKRVTRATVDLLI